MRTLYSKQVVELQGWEREEQFGLFGSYTQPFFNVHTEVEITSLYHYCKAHQLSVFLGYLYAALQSARAIDNFKLRLLEGQVVQFSNVDIGTTVLKDDKSLSFLHLPYQEDMVTFCEEGAALVAEVKKSKRMFHGYDGPDLLHTTTLPWFKLRGLEHAYTINSADEGIPKLAFGRLEFKEDKVILPVSVSLHHGLADGYHVHLFLQQMSEVVNQYICYR